MNDFEKRLQSGRVLVADGATGTELARRGLAGAPLYEVWNIDRPDVVQAVAASYVEAGAEVILTNTLCGTRIKLAGAGLAEKTAEVNRRAAEIARTAAGGKALVFASVGPTGELLEPLGELTEAAAVEAFAEQARALEAGGVDGFCVESFSDISEALAALKGLRKASKRPVVVSLTFSKGPRGFATMMGVTPEQAAKELEAAGADAVGANCGIGSAQAVEIARLLKPATRLPIWIKPNAGLPQLVGGHTIFPETPDEFAANGAAIARAGAAIVGGCCGSTPEHIRRLAALLSSM